MIRDALGEALHRMRDTPPLWITGLYLGSLFAGDILLEIQGNSVLAARIGFLGLCALPFFLGGSYGAIQGAGTGVRGYLAAGRRYFFRILLAGAVIVSAALLTALLVMAPVALIGGSLQDTSSLVLLWVGIPFAFFTFFYDTAVVFEDRKVLDSIRRAVEFVTGNPKGAMAFYLVNLGVGILVLFLAVAVWSVTIADRLEPFVGANQTVFQNMTATQLVALIGIPGVWTGVVIGFFAVLIWGTFLVSFKACYYRRAVVASPAAPVVGEFDEKGRWYRY
jgi:hypothetical protein